MNVPVLDNRQARRLFLHKHGLSTSPSGSGKGADLAQVINDLGFVQIDSVNTFARAHDQILWSRRQQFRPRALELALSRDRAVFEHWTHDAATVPMDFYPFWRLRFERAALRLPEKWDRDRRAGFMQKADAVMRRISDHGCCTSADVGADEQKGSGGWWDWHPSKTALEYLWHSGQLAVSRRDGFRKVYDLPERVIPDRARSSRLDTDEIVDWLCNGALNRLGFATSGEVADFWDIVTKQEAKAWCARELAAGRIIEVDVTAWDGKARRSFTRPGVMDAQPAAPPPRVRVLSPFDPALRDRKRAERLFGFNYRIEIFVPAPKRVYGYYVFPVIEGDRMIGRIDMRRNGRVLDVTAFWPEAGVKMGTGRLDAVNKALLRAASFGGCDDLRYAPDWLRA